MVTKVTSCMIGYCNGNLLGTSFTMFIVRKDDTIIDIEVFNIKHGCCDNIVNYHHYHKKSRFLTQNS